MKLKIAMSISNLLTAALWFIEEIVDFGNIDIVFYIFFPIICISNYLWTGMYFSEMHDKLFDIKDFQIKNESDCDYLEKFMQSKITTIFYFEGSNILYNLILSCAYAWFMAIETKLFWPVIIIALIETIVMALFGLVIGSLALDANKMVKSINKKISNYERNN